MGINYFSSEEDRKKFYRETIEHQENSIRFIEGAIKCNQDLIKCNTWGKELQEKLKVEKEKLIQQKIEYNKRYPATPQEKALKMGLTVIRGGALQ